MSLERGRIKSIIESLIFVSSEPLPLAKIRAVLESIPVNDVKSIIGELQADCLASDRGVYLEEVAMGYQFRTNPENTDWIAALVETKPRRFSKASLETLAIIAYNQPITRPEIENIRGVDSSSAVNLLLERRIVKIVGRKDVPGKPFLFGTTKEFLELFNLKELSELPTLQEIENLEETHPEFFENEVRDDKPDESDKADENEDSDSDGDVMPDEEESTAEDEPIEEKDISAEDNEDDADDKYGDDEDEDEDDDVNDVADHDADADDGNDENDD